MYTLKDLKNVQVIKQYVMKAMAEMKCGEVEIKEYRKQTASKDFYTVIQISQEYIDMLNNIEKERQYANACIKGYISQI